MPRYGRCTFPQMCHTASAIDLSLIAHAKADIEVDEHKTKLQTNPNFSRYKWTAEYLVGTILHRINFVRNKYLHSFQFRQILVYLILCFVLTEHAARSLTRALAPLHICPKNIHSFIY